MTPELDHEDFADLLESVVAMMDGARHEANVSVAHGEKLAAVALQLMNSLQSIVEFGAAHFPSEWKIGPPSQRPN